MSRQAIVLFGLGVIFCMTLSFASGLECYDCDGDVQDCTNLETADTMECSSSKFCTKIVLDGVITRSCHVGTNTPEEGCNRGGSTETCYCSSDLCNHSARLEATGIGALMLAILAIWAR